jgi:hypothetical protein
MYSTAFRSFLRRRNPGLSLATITAADLFALVLQKARDQGLPAADIEMFRKDLSTPQMVLIAEQAIQARRAQKAAEARPKTDAEKAEARRADIQRKKRMLIDAVNKQRSQEKYKGETVEIMREDADRFASMSEVKGAITNMITALAALPPPGPGALADGMGFSPMTNRPMRHFLSRVEGGEDLPMTDWLDAARLLIIHSKTQLPRERVMGAMRYLEDQINTGKVERPYGYEPMRREPGKGAVSASGATLLSLTEDAVSDKAIGKVGWVWNGGDRVTFTAPQNVVKQLHASLQAEGYDSRLIENATTHRTIYSLDLPLNAVPLLADLIESFGESGERATVHKKIRKVFDAWKQKRPGAATAPPQNPEVVEAREKARKASLDPFPVHAGLNPREGSRGADQYSTIYWLWGPGKDPEIAFAFSDWEFRERGKQETNRAGPFIAKAAENEGIRMRKSGEKKHRDSGGYRRSFYKIKAEDIPKLYPFIEKYHQDKIGLALRALKKVVPIWQKHTTTTPKVPKTGREIARRGWIGEVRWEYSPGKNGIRLSFPKDSDRGYRDQISMAAAEAGIVHRDLGRGVMLLTPAQIPALLKMMEEQDRFPEAVEPMRKMLPYWRQFFKENIPKSTGEEKAFAKIMARRFGYMMEEKDAQNLLENMPLYAGYLTSIKPQETSGLDLGPYGAWWIKDAKTVKQKTRTKQEGTIKIDLRGLPKHITDLAHEKKGEWGTAFPLKNLLKLARFLDPIVPPLALSLRAALMVEEGEVQCKLQDTLAASTDVEDIRNSEIRGYVEDTIRRITPGLKEGVSLLPAQEVGVAFLRSTGLQADGSHRPPRGILGDAMGTGKTLQTMATLLTDEENLLPALVIAPTSVVTTWPEEAIKFTHLKVRTILSGEGEGTLSEKVDRALKEPRSNWDILSIGWGSIREPGVEDALEKGFTKKRLKSIVLDEVHKAKDPTAKRSKVAKNLASVATGARILLSGTLIMNKLEDAWHPLHILDPIQFDTLKRFKAKYVPTGAKPKRIVNRVLKDRRTGNPLKDEKGNIKYAVMVIDDPGYEGLSAEEIIAKQYAELADRLRCFMVRRLKKDIFKDMNPKIRNYVPLTLNADEDAEYRRTLRAMRDWICDNVRRYVAQKAAGLILKAQERDVRMSPDEAVRKAIWLSQEGRKNKADQIPFEEFSFSKEALNGYADKYQNIFYRVAWGVLNRFTGRLKIPHIVCAVKRYFTYDDADDDQGPLILFMRHKDVIRAVTKALRGFQVHTWTGKKKTKRLLRVAVWIGDTPTPKRTKIKEDFQKGKIDLIIASQALTEGVTLTAADNAIFGELWLNPALVNQAEDRIHRYQPERPDAQKRIQHLYFANTHDELIRNLLAKKEALIDAVLGSEDTDIEQRMLVKGGKDAPEAVFFGKVIEDEDFGECIDPTKLQMITLVDKAADLMAIGEELPKTPSFAPGIDPGVDDLDSPRGNPRRRRNAARAAVGGYQGARLTSGHFSEATTKKAIRVAARARREGKRLGRGNFGEAFRVGRHVVKLPTTHDMHGKPRSRSEQREAFIHEAGVANELAATGHRVVPITVYVELVDGTPALVREYGEMPKTISTEEIAKLEQDLYAVEKQGIGWDVADDLLVMRRKDGSLFIADVGFWRKRKKTRPERGWDSYTDTPTLLSIWATSNDLPDSLVKVLYKGDKFFKPDLGGLRDKIEFYALMAADGEGIPLLIASATRDLDRFADEMAIRQQYGLYVPAHAADLVQRLRQQISSWR